jgi:hypothetical protein
MGHPFLLTVVPVKSEMNHEQLMDVVEGQIKSIDATALLPPTFLTRSNVR